MPVIINDIAQSTGSSAVVAVSDGQRDHALIALTFAWDNVATPSRGTPSGGGSSWYAVYDVTVNWYYTASYNYKLRAYMWYSYPTERGDVTLNTGTASGEGQFAVVYSISNAKYYMYRYVPNIQATEIYDYSKFQKQGSTLFGTSIGVVRDGVFTTQTMYDAVFGATKGFNFSDVHPEEPSKVCRGYIAAYHAQEHGQRLSAGAGQRYVFAGTDWNESSPVPYSACVQTAIDTVECL